LYSIFSAILSITFVSFKSYQSEVQQSATSSHPVSFTKTKIMADSGMCMKQRSRKELMENVRHARESKAHNISYVHNIGRVNIIASVLSLYEITCVLVAHNKQNAT
jgi:hypothetical protein